jgi:hypothetical protein
MANRNYCWTLFIEDGNCDEVDRLDDFIKGGSEDMEYGASSRKGWKYHRSSVFQKESCPETGREHYQGYSEFTRPVRISSLKVGVFNTAHFERRRGTRDQAIAYCSKEESRVEEPVWVGDFKRGGHGRRVDLQEVKCLLDEGSSELTISEEHFAAWCRYHKAFRRYRDIHVTNRNWKTTFKVFWGDAGAGKTRAVYDAHGVDCVYDVPRPNGGSVWFDGYVPSQHTAILFDDFYGWCPLHLLLKMADRYPMQLPVKGGHVPMVATHLYITSNTHYDDWYKWDEWASALKDAFVRRIDECKHFLLNDFTD